jgi:hypothetical protein
MMKLVVDLKAEIILLFVDRCLGTLTICRGPFQDAGWVMSNTHSLFHVAQSLRGVFN